METLSNDALQLILLELPYEELVEKCSVSRQYQRICADDYFWKSKFVHDYPGDKRNVSQSWRENYEREYHKEPCWSTNIKPDDYNASGIIADCVTQAIDQNNYARLRDYIRRKIFPSRYGDLSALRYAYASDDEEMTWFLIREIPLQKDDYSFRDFLYYLIAQRDERATKLALEKIEATGEEYTADFVEKLAGGGFRFLALLDEYIQKMLDPKNKHRVSRYDTRENILRKAYRGAGAASRGDVLDFLSERYLLTNKLDQANLYSHALSEAIGRDPKFVKELFEKYPEIITDGYRNTTEIFVREAIERNDLESFTFFLDHDDLVEYKKLMEEIVRLYSLTKVTFRLEPFIDALINKGYDNIPAIVTETLRYTPEYFNRYREELDSNSLLEGGILWNDPGAVQEALSTEVDISNKALNRAILDLLVESSEQDKYRRQLSIEDAQLLKDLLEYAEEHGYDLEMSDYLEAIMYNQTISGAQKIPFLKLVTNYLTRKPLTNALMIALYDTEYLDPEVEQFLISHGADRRLADKLHREG